VVAAPAPPGIPELASLLGSDMQRAQRWARWFPAWLKREIRTLGARVAAPDAAPEELTASLSPADREVFADADVVGRWLATWREAFRQGADGPWLDLVVISQPWGFAPSEIEIPVLLWFGAADRQVPPAIGRYLANALQRSEARLYAREGHFSLFTRRSDEIFDGLAAAVDRAAHHS
jgi:pimeloyl-ACP methyl ester carboxylesterase